MKFTPLALSGAYQIDLDITEDDRGFFARCYCEKQLLDNDLETRWVQMNNTLTREIGSIRGMHFQYPPNAETKMVRCLRGAVWDVMVDLREGSQTLGAWFGIILSDSNRTMVYIPKGFAHGFQTLQPNTELLYWHSNYYSAENEGGLKYDDPEVGIEWPLPISRISGRDNNHPTLNNITPIKL